MTSEKQIICFECNKAIVSGQIALTAMEKNYHKECFRCHKCNIEIGGGVFKVIHGQHMCSACFEKATAKKTAGTCPKCHQEIKGAFLGAINQKFHPECFLCEKCQTNISRESFQVKENQPYCVNCYTDLFAPTCVACKKHIKPTEPYLEVEKDILHQSCFTCQVCKVSLIGKPFGVKKNVYYCQPHATKAK